MPPWLIFRIARLPRSVSMFNSALHSSLSRTNAFPLDSHLSLSLSLSRSKRLILRPLRDHLIGLACPHLQFCTQTFGFTWQLFQVRHMERRKGLGHPCLQFYQILLAVRGCPVAGGGGRQSICYDCPRMNVLESRYLSKIWKMGWANKKEFHTFTCTYLFLF